MKKPQFSLLAWKRQHGLRSLHRMFGPADEAKVKKPPERAADERGVIRMGNKTRLRGIWNNMLYRCYGQKLSEHTARAYRDKGISVCDEWVEDFDSFKAWAFSHGYSNHMTIDRIDPNGNYCPENCRWVTMEENRNRRGQTELAFVVSEVENIPPEKFDSTREQEQTIARGLADACKRLGPEQMQLLMIFCEGFTAAMDHFGIQPAVENRTADP